jgi:hypothetical protein
MPPLVVRHGDGDGPERVPEPREDDAFDRVVHSQMTSPTRTTTATTMTH